MLHAQMPAKKKQHYVDNKKFLDELVKYKQRVATAEIQNKPKPLVNNYIGDCFLKIATHLSYRPNFINYMYKDDMMGWRTVSNTSITSIQKSPPTPLHTSLRLCTMPSLEELRKRSVRWISRTRFWSAAVTSRYSRLTEETRRSIILSSIASSRTPEVIDE